MPLLDFDVHFGEVADDPLDWRELPDDDSPDDDEEQETPVYVTEMLGFDPQKEFGKGMDDFSSDLFGKFNPRQERVPAGSPKGGQWTTGMGGSLKHRPMNVAEKERRARMVGLLTRSDGIAEKDLMAAMGWNNMEHGGAWHLAALRRAGHKIVVTRGPDGQKVYRIAGKGTPAPPRLHPAEKPQTGDKLAVEAALQSGISSGTKRIKNHGGGISETYHVVFKDGSEAAWKPTSGEPTRQVHKNITPGMDAAREAGAWQVAKRVGMGDLVAPSVLHTMPDGQKGVMIAWVKGKMAAEVPYDKRFDGQKDAQRAAVFDYVIGNQDRHAKNWLVDGNRLRLIDHGLSFPEGGRRGWNHHIVDHAHMYQRSSIRPSDLAKPYLAAMPSIVQALSDLKLPAAAIKGVERRAQRLGNMNDWGSFRW